MTQHFRTVVVEPGPNGVQAALTAVHELFEDEISCALVSNLNKDTVAAIAADRPLHSDEPSLVVVTSGSTGKPRGVEITASALAISAEMSAVYFRNQAVWLTALPVTSLGGLNTVVRSALAGTAPAIWDGVGGAAPFTAADFVPFLKAVRTSATKQRMAAATSLVPTQLHRLADDADALAALAQLDYVLVGGGATPHDLLERCSAVNIVRTYGATETCGGLVYNGTPLDGVEIAIDDAGCVVVYSPSLALCYRDGQSIAAHGWSSNDTGTFENGLLRISGRRDDVVKVSGHNVGLEVIADAARSFADAGEVAVAAASDAEYGTVPVICFTGTANAEDMRVHIRRQLAAPIPLRIVFVERIPLLENGKPDRGRIAEL